MGLILAVLLAVVAIYVAVLAYNAVKAGKYIGKGIAVQNTITISGNGDVSTKPDLAVMDFSVVSEGKTVAAATDDNTKKMNAIVAAAKSLGVADKDLQTTGYSINPRYDYVKQAISAPISVPAIGSAMGAGSRDIMAPSLLSKRPEGAFRIRCHADAHGENERYGQNRPDNRRSDRGGRQSGGRFAIHA